MKKAIFYFDNSYQLSQIMCYIFNTMKFWIKTQNLTTFLKSTDVFLLNISISVAGAIVGSFVWWRRPQNRLNADEYIQYKAMLISLATHLLLLMFELLVADNLANRR